LHSDKVLEDFVDLILHSVSWNSHRVLLCGEITPQCNYKTKRNIEQLTGLAL